MKFSLTGLDVLSILFAAALAVQLGSRFQPNIVVFLFAFFFLRLLLQWLFFKTFVHRDLPYVRSTIQFVMILLVVPLVLFVVSLIPGVGGMLANINLTYYLILPLLGFITSWGLQKYLDIEG
jgi:hypothetical protein